MIDDLLLQMRIISASKHTTMCSPSWLGGLIGFLEAKSACTMTPGGLASHM
jgi:hypothetical protein